jgi:3-hydroxybutyrate dehydrogenase
MTSPLAGRCALVTGSTQGLGLAIATELAAAGCNVALAGLTSSDTAARLQNDLENAHGVRTVYSDADLRRPGEIARMVADTASAFGSIDILVNNAVVRHVGLVEDTTTDAWDESVAVNLSAAFHAIRLTMPGMKRNNWGRIVNVSSVFGLRGASGRVGYVTTKTALIGLTRAVALEAVGHDITCNAVCPGTTETPVHRGTVQALMDTQGLPQEEAEHRVLAGKQPTGRFVPAQAVAALVLYLCGPLAADITGAALPVDGGWASRA